MEIGHGAGWEIAPRATGDYSWHAYYGEQLRAGVEATRRGAIDAAERALLELGLLARAIARTDTARPRDEWTVPGGC